MPSSPDDFASLFFQDTGERKSTNWTRLRDGVRERETDLAAQLAEAVGLLRAVYGYGMAEDCEDREAVRAFLARVDGAKEGG